MGVVVGGVGVPVATGNFSVTGLPFQPVAVVFWNQYQPLGPHSMMFGCATSSSEQWAVWTGTDSEISAYNKRYHEARSDRCAFNYAPPFTTIAWTAALVSMNSDGFTLDLVDRNAGGVGEGNVIYYMAIGGSHISEAHAGTFTAGGSTGTVAVTDPGFRPTALIAAHAGDVTWGSGQANNSELGIGVTDGVSQFSSYVLNWINTAILVNHIYRTDGIGCFYDGTNTMVTALDSFDANGFTVDVLDAYTDFDFGYLAINADGAVAGHDVQPNSNTTLTYDTPGLIPEGVFFCWPGVDVPSTSGSNTAPLRPGVGGGTISEERLSAGIGRNDTPFGVYTSDGYQSNTEPMGFWGTGSGIGGGDNQSQASANIDALNSGSFDLVWSDVLDTNDRVFGWLALPGELVIAWIPHIYRRVMSAVGAYPQAQPLIGDILLENGDGIELEDGTGVLIL